MSTQPDDVLLEVKGLRTHFTTDSGEVRAVNGADLTLRRGRTLCVVGESGCGKSVTARSILQLVERPGRVVGGQVLLRRRGADGTQETIDLAALGPRDRRIRQVRGRDIAMVFQEPMASLSLVHRVGNQIGEAIRVHNRVSRAEARRRSVALLERVGIPAPERIVDAYPFQLSGGMRQRVMIAMALSCEPELLIADEPTTALDVTTQAQILDLLADLQDSRGMAMLFITHDMGVVAEIADDVAVMYLGSVVEQGAVDDVFHAPRHPYTRALLESIPRMGAPRRARLPAIRGSVPDPARQPSGCVFRDRCDHAMPGRCDTTVPVPVALEDGRRVRCLLYGGDTPAAPPPSPPPHPTSAPARRADEEAADVD
ncbi:ABC transporter ATP-binding protein [Streptomonospora nanhaiensis]|uniref:ABC transporter ATP-binding protein n=1 Tax=Streptomonospora nanhaiensis TaxID=1323731 RepID=UPI001C3822C2|nr:ABC transporter ATP-binding protein [Streptomonospora nanhaiensis]MBV2363348.1 ABC transporter ATP-binding protein [Streptomonospora nanhaiensis]MBX9388512.1 ABC transporter ATP-binding protein [Streptomonospora nanhaiensis]